MTEYQYFIDNQNCLWLPSNSEEISEEVINQLSLIIDNTNTTPKSLYLNHSVFMDKYENPDVIIPNDTEAFYYRITFKNCIKRIYIPASVEKITVSPSSDFYVDEHSVEFVVSEKNKNFVSVNGSIYTKDFKTLVYSAQKKGTPFLLDPRCEEIADSAKLFVDKKLTFDISYPKVLPNLKTINFRGIISKSTKLKIPEGVEKLKKGFWFITKPYAKTVLYIPSTVNEIEKNPVSRYKVSKKNKAYTSYKNDLYSTNYKTFYAGDKKHLKIKNGCEEVYLSGADCETIFLPKSVKNIYELDSNQENIRFVVNQENPYFSEYKGSLYTKDFETLLFLHLVKNGSFHDIHIHPDCKKIHSDVGIKKYRTRIGKVFPGNLFLTEEQIKSFKNQIFKTSLCERVPIEIQNFTMEKIRNSIHDETVRFGLSGIEIDKNTVLSDNFLLLNCNNDKSHITKPCFYQKEDFEDAKDFLQEEWNGILMDCKIKDIIEKLNAQKYKTRACCSGHILHAEQIFSNEGFVGNVLSRKPYGTICQGYIYFDCIPQHFKKMFKKLPNISQEKLRKRIETSYTEPVFFFSTDKKRAKSFLDFYYINTIQEQTKVFDMLREKITQ